ncbi:MAG: hypothetical protein Q4B26_20975 [Eubacteriales bacterium]|nr:hypothetical protein [Eubacteriales bacterium]
MSAENWQEITMDSESFSQIRNDFDVLLQRLFKKMETNKSDEGKISLQINVKMETDFVPQEDGSSREIWKPTLKHKINTEVPVKDNFDGKKETGMELVYDEELKRYVLRYVSVGGQRCIFDDDFDIINGETTEVVEGQPLLESKPLMIEGDVIDAEEAETDVSGDDGTEDGEIQAQEDRNAARGGTEASEDDTYEYDE